MLACVCVGELLVLGFNAQACISLYH